MKTKLGVFVTRLERIGIRVELVGNFPWIYLDKVNGKLVTEKFQAVHGFTLCFLPIRKDQDLRFTDLTEIFKILRKYR